MKQLTVIKSVRFTPQQVESLRILALHNVNINQFIRSAVKEKIQRDWKSIKEKKERINVPF